MWMGNHVVARGIPECRRSSCSSWYQIGQVFGPWASPYGANGGLNIDWDCLVPHCIMGSHDQWEFTPFFGPQWQSLCTTLMAGKCLMSVLCKGTVKSLANHCKDFLELPIFTYHTYYTSKQMYNWMKWLRLLGGWHFIAATAIKPPKAACQFAADDILLYDFCYHNPMDLLHHWEKGKEELSPLQYHIKSLHIIWRHYKKSLLRSKIYHG